MAPRSSASTARRTTCTGSVGDHLRKGCGQKGLGLAGGDDSGAVANNHLPIPFSSIQTDELLEPGQDASWDGGFAHDGIYEFSRRKPEL
jgi:hypothetical protein